MAWEMTGREPRAVGVYAPGDVLYLVEVERADGRYEIRQAIRQACRTAEAATTAEGLAEEVSLLCQTHGLSRRVGIVCPREECFLFERVYPAMEGKELSQAVQWDIAVNCPFSGESAWSGFSARQGRTLVAVLDESRGRDRWRAFRKAGLEVAEMFLAPEELTAQPAKEAVSWGDRSFRRGPRAREADWPEEMTWALYGAWNVLRPEQAGTIGFLPPEYRPETRPWLSYAMAALAVTFFLMAEAFLINHWRLHEASRQLAEVRQRYGMMGAARQQAAEIRRLREENEETDEALVQLSKKRRSWYYAFYVMGLLQVEGVQLLQIVPVEDGALRLRGQAPSYGALMEYFSLYEDNAALLSAPPVLEHFEQAEPGTLSFTMKLMF